MQATSDPQDRPVKDRPEGIAERIYAQLRDDIFELRLMPGDRFSEGDIARRMEVSRTPVRQALFRLEREGYLEVYFRSGWQVRPFDFRHFEELYDVRIVLELAAVQRLCERAQADVYPAQLDELRAAWMVPPARQLTACADASALDERFHNALVETTGNRQLTTMHWEVTEKIRIIRRLDFTQPVRIAATYQEHNAILQAILARQLPQAQRLLTEHILASKLVVRNITLHMLSMARTPL
ncbi:GntR family transcriptional regulator [Acerihabitans sp.]|uniref:GntR family transcriptional regulator n=1 Tax=Acerihabitans sp. TaxID=2811394 RepID=UPI002ED77714